MKHRESEQTQLRVSRLLNRDSVNARAAPPPLGKGLPSRMPAMRALPRLGWPR